MAVIQTVGIPQTPVVTKQYGAGIVTDPRHMPVSICYASMQFKTAYNLSSNLGAAAPADLTRKQFTSATRANIVSVAGSGVVTHVITPGFGSAASTPTIYINIDGTEYQFITTATITAQRWVMGVVSMGNPETSTTATFNTSLAKGLTQFGIVDDAGHIAKVGKNAVFSPNSGTYTTLPSIAQILNAGLPRLRFEKYLSVDMAFSAFTANTQYDDSAYVGYVLD